MYKVTIDGSPAGYSDTAVFIIKASNGCYAPCGELEADGVCVKRLYQQETDDGVITTVRDEVYSLEGKTLEGATQTASVEKVSGPIEINAAEQVVNTLLGGNV